MRMIAIVTALALLIPVCAIAVSTSRTSEPKSGAEQVIPPSTPVVERPGGETMADAFLIPSLPFSDTGTTVGHIDDYDWCCPYTGSTSKDVVYKYVSPYWTHVTVDLCSSLYDTKVYIVDETWPNVIACNDDYGCGYSGYQSRLDMIPLDVGRIYYFVVDGYGGMAGTYILSISESECYIPCPPGAYVEQEPVCYDNYIDDSNSGCGHDPVLFENIAPSPPGEDVVVCGTSGTYLFNGLDYRDTDWFQLTLTEPKTIRVACQAYFPLLLVLIYNADCDNPEYDYSYVPFCQVAEITRTVGPGNVWVWVGPSVFSGVECGSDYVMTIEGYDLPTPVESVGWGAVKALYR